LHRPDLVLLGDPPEAVEVELTAKSARRLDEILRAWRRSVGRGQFAGVRYLCSVGTLPYLQRAAARTRTEELIGVEPLEFSIGAQPSSRFAMSAETSELDDFSRHLGRKA
jgi:hypothetical protein